MTDPVIDDLLNQFLKTAVVTDDVGVSFRGKGLKLDSDADCKDVVNAINNTPDMTYLNLEGNTLGVDAAKVIGEALNNRGKLSRALWNNMFTGRMKTEIPKALIFLSSGLTTAGAMLTELDLSDNAFGPIGVEALADLLKSNVCYKLQELRLNNNGLGITGGKILAKALLSAHKNSTEAGQPLALKVFIAGRNRLENDGATALSEVFKTLGSLEEIRMPQNGIYYKGISMISDALTQNKNLRLLDLNDNTLTAKGANFLAKALPSLQKLQILNLGDCLIKTKGAVILADALAEKHLELEEVHLDSNDIRIEGGLAITRAMSNKKNLQKLNLQGNEFGDKGRESLKNEADKFKLGNQLFCPSDDDMEASDGERDEDDNDYSDDNEEDDDSASSTSELEGDDDDDNPDVALSANLNTSELVTRDILTSIADNDIQTFLLTPSIKNFNILNSKSIDDIILSLKQSNKIHVPLCILLIMRVSNLGSNKDEVIRKQSRNLAISLYKALFTWAEKEDQLILVNNVLFVYLQLIKDEDSNLKINWDVDRCVKVLQAAIVEKIIPSFTQDTLTFCLDRKLKNVEESVKT